MNCPKKCLPVRRLEQQWLGHDRWVSWTKNGWFVFEKGLKNWCPLSLVPDDTSIYLLIQSVVEFLETQAVMQLVSRSRSLAKSYGLTTHFSVWHACFVASLLRVSPHPNHHQIRFIIPCRGAKNRLETNQAHCQCCWFKVYSILYISKYPQYFLILHDVSTWFWGIFGHESKPDPFWNHKSKRGWKVRRKPPNFHFLHFFLQCFAISWPYIWDIGTKQPHPGTPKLISHEMPDSQALTS